MCLKRFLTLLLVLFSFCFYSVASEIQQGLTSIEDFAINIENSSLMQKQQIELLTIDLSVCKKLLEDYQTQQIKTLQTQEALLKQLKDLEQKCRNWKTFAMVAIPLTAITATGITYMVLSNK